MYTEEKINYKSKLQQSFLYARTSGGEFPAHAAAHEGNVELLGMLIHEGRCGVNDRDSMEATPAHKGKTSWPF